MNKRKHAVKLAKAAKRKPYRTKFDHAVDNSIAKEQAQRKRRRPR